MCTLRHLTKKDKPSFAIPATLLASASFISYPDNSAALYIMWKSLQISYNLLERNGYAPNIPGFMLFLYCASTATLFHAATMEPLNLRPSYWKFYTDCLAVELVLWIAPLSTFMDWKLQNKFKRP